MKKVFELVIILGMLVSVAAFAASDDVLRIKVMKDGTIYANDSTLSVDQLGELFNTVGKGAHEVWYYREQGESEPHPNAMKVIKAVVDQGLPISLTRDSNFSNCVPGTGCPA
ncbi:MAG TPA: hypothetical protein PLY88_00020 [Candidatus Omnitrophota bacterium]|nr:hypothetical protein [Candidatus Omnitrophota bacterium]